MATSTALPFRCRNWLAVTLTAKVSAACTSWQKAVKETTEAGIFFQKLSPSLLQHVSSYQKSSPVNHPSAALLALLHTGTAALYALPLENLHFRTRHNTSLNKGQVSTQKFSQTTARTALPFCARLFFTSEAHKPAWPALSQSSPVPLGSLGLGDPSTCWALRTRSPRWRCITAGPQHVPAAFAWQPGRSGTGRPTATGGQPEQRASKRACARIKGSYGFPFALTHLLLYFNIYGNNFSQYQSTKELNELSTPSLPWNLGTEQVRGPYGASRLPLIPEVCLPSYQLR